MFDFNTDDERAVSPVIGVILMVAITVILAAVIGAFVLNLGSNVDSNLQAGAQVQSDSNNDRITVTYTSAQQSGINLSANTNGADTDGTFFLNETGATAVIDTSGTSISGLGSTGSTAPIVADGNTVTITVTAIKGDKSSQVLSKTVEL